jgi:hypothetical protein
MSPRAPQDARRAPERAPALLRRTTSLLGRGIPLRARLAVAAMSLALGAAACGDTPTAPRITNLRIEPVAGVRAGDTLTARVDFVDDDGDLGGGAAELSLRHVEAPEGQLFVVALTSDVEADKGTVTLKLRIPAAELPGPHELSVALLDATERRSPPLVAELLVLD